MPPPPQPEQLTGGALLGTGGEPGPFPPVPGWGGPGLWTRTLPERAGGPGRGSSHRSANKRAPTTIRAQAGPWGLAALRGATFLSHGWAGGAARGALGLVAFGHQYLMTPVPHSHGSAVFPTQSAAEGDGCLGRNRLPAAFRDRRLETGAGVPGGREPSLLPVTQTRNILTARNGAAALRAGR